MRCTAGSVFFNEDLHIVHNLHTSSKYIFFATELMNTCIVISGPVRCFIDVV